MSLTTDGSVATSTNFIQMNGTTCTCTWYKYSRELHRRQTTYNTSYLVQVGTIKRIVTSLVRGTYATATVSRRFQEFSSVKRHMKACFILIF